ncbi:MAG: glycoside hydrolase family 5 protein [Treponema sp.]|nr:glycoside hydrolase family 5 protein [Treponema sp.]MCL2272932.1 glycoside hydrolase family 5 protein [Treponema sp.]
MKKLFLFVLIFTAFLLFSSQSRNNQQQVPQVPFSKGVNFTFWFGYAKNALGINPARYTEQDFEDIKRLGFDVIRLPIDFSLYSSGAPNYIIDPHLFRLLDNAVDLAEKFQLYIILDNHPGSVPLTGSNIRNVLLPIWRQVAEHYKNRSEYVIYEIMNEPNGISNNDWGRIQGDVINAIRRIDPNRWIVVGGSNYNSIDDMISLPRYTDKKLLYTFHFYDPSIFTHQETNFVAQYKHLTALIRGIPFPYDRNRMPEVPNELKGTYYEEAYKNYSREGTPEALIKQIDKAANFARQRNVPVFNGEIGVPWRQTVKEDRLMWYRTVIGAFKERNIPWLNWGYFEAFGLFNPQIDSLFFDNFWGDINTDLNVDLIRVFGLNPVPQRKREMQRSGFSIYDDAPGRGVIYYYFPPLNTINWYYTPAAEGRYAIHLGNLKRYEGMELQLPVMDLTFLAQNGYVLEFKARTERAFTFDIILMSFQDNINWFNSYRIDQRQLPPDGKWHTIRVPLRDMLLYGGYDKDFNYVDARGRSISWTNINMLRISAEHQDGSVHDLFLDSIKVIR